MGRETKLLLGLLALLAGVFMGLLSMKLLVPRPPAGTGPDIHTDVAVASEPQDLVEPPRLDRPSPPEYAPPPNDTIAGQPSRFVAPPPVSGAAASMLGAVPPAAPTRSDPFVSTASHEQPPVGEDLLPPTPPTGRSLQPAAFTVPAEAASIPIAPTSAAISGAYVARDGDSWWSVAERAYGDGRLYRALFAWNRAIDPRVSLVPGTSIEVPSLDRLRAAWPGLLPRESQPGSDRP
jgi:5'-nucleotidase